MKTLLLLLLPSLMYAQYYADVCEIKPQFKGGDTALAQFIHDSIVLPVKEIQQPIIFNATLSIDATGKPRWVEYYGQIPEDMQHQLRKVFKIMPFFLPGQNNGKASDCKKTINISIPSDTYLAERSKLLWSDSVYALELRTAKIKGWDTLTTAQQKRKLREINEIGINGRNGYQTKVTDMDFNFVNDRIGLLMNDLKLDIKGNETGIMKGNTFSFDYGKLKVNYSVTQENHDMIITQCDISGDVWTAIKFFVFFWDTTLKFEDLKENEIVWRGYYDERIGFKLLPGSQTATIMIRKAKT